ncbi:MAG TPA: response regulator transcription factor [Polyangia bacterium]|jgi:DNA-binding NarL/FixJ family response regulator|nr:response regulator transcription factor [Polyangia bacterium]
MIRVLVVDDHDIVRDALASLLGDVSDFQVVGVASSIRDALPLLDSARPDIVLADLSLGDGSAVELVRALRRGRLKGRVIVITGFSDEFAAAEALAAGATGYVLKSQPTAELLEAIRTVADGRKYVAPTLERRLAMRSINSESSASGGAVGLERLSPREVEVFRLVVAGSSSKDVARRLCISVKTVETHRTNMNRKLAVRTTADLVRFAAAHGIAVAPRADVASAGVTELVGNQVIGRRDGMA